MINQKRILAVIPARGGSKGIPNKNIFPVNNKPLLTYTLEFIKKLAWIDHSYVSSDSEKILSIAYAHGFDNNPTRPRDLSGDKVGDMPVLKFALTQVEKKHGRFDYIIMFQPTSPIREIEFTLQAIKKLISKNYDSVLSIQEVKSRFNPLKQLVIAGKTLSYFDQKGKNITARQELEKTYLRDGVFYGFTRNHILNYQSVIGPNSSYVVNNNFSVNIDDYEDLKIFENYILNLETK